MPNYQSNRKKVILTRIFDANLHIILTLKLKEEEKYICKWYFMKQLNIILFVNIVSVTNPSKWLYGHHFPWKNASCVSQMLAFNQLVKWIEKPNINRDVLIVHYYIYVKTLVLINLSLCPNQQYSTNNTWWVSLTEICHL